jgi:hypothetical protein
MGLPTGHKGHKNASAWLLILLPITSRPIPFTVRIMLAQELADLRAAEVALTLKVIDARGEIYPN